MFKKIILTLTVFSYITTFSSEVLNPQEMKIYHAIKQQFPKIHHINDMEKFLKENNISSQKLYQILSKKKRSLSQESIYLSNYLRSLNESTITNSVMKLLVNLLPSPGYSSIPGGAGLAYGLMIFGPAIIGIPTLIIGTVMQKFIAPSPTNTIISSGLIGAGGLLSMPASLVTLAITTGTTEKKIKGIIYQNQKSTKRNQLSEISAEENIILPIMWKLQDFYPEIAR
jgi:hypothetical protein